ncbi:hypothetical protein EW146_g3651 [Bondarzewia mesenterica]|uniref:U6 small nuclear RNA (adenine-(43)-N(6))-methyltransferase n=1 Tax=Bondarzewia mesenterica TaxID=1095465 RepID=A0A4S4LZ61_9AGAM|nr:hypothetical protein EW146_g3651 [Bondarzewia mesenterica]
MHPRNPYRTPPDFASLAESYPALQTHIKTSPTGGATIDFKDAAAQRSLMEALLYRDFGLFMNIPDNRLCPPVPNRLNYVLWIQDIIRAHSDHRVGASVKGIDIGTGASTIYPLLACRLSPSWTMIGTEVDDVSFRSAQENVERNKLADRITIVAVSKEGPLLVPLATDPTDSFDFVMCNPPFYSSAEDVARSVDSKELGPNAVCTGADVEMITEGGESAAKRGAGPSDGLSPTYAFPTYALANIFRPAFDLRSHSHTISHFLPQTLARISNPTIQNLMPAHTTLRQPIPHAASLALLHTTLSSLPSIHIEPCTTESPSSSILVSAQTNSWSRAARRRPVAAESGTGPPLMVCRVSVLQDEDGAGATVVATWVRGRDRAAFESFF